MCLQDLMFANSQLWGAPGFQDVPSRTCKWTHAISSGGVTLAGHQAGSGWMPTTWVHATPSNPTSQPLSPPGAPTAARGRAAARRGQTPSLTVHRHSPSLCRERCLFLILLLHIVQKKKKTEALLKYTDSWIPSQTWQYKYLKTEALESVFILSPLIDFYVKIKNHCNLHLYLALVWDSGIVNTKYRIS